MSLWKKYIKKRAMIEGLADAPNAVDRFNFNDDQPEDYERVCQDLFKLVMTKYPEESRDFLESIASRGDEEVSSLMKKFRKEGGSKLSRGPRHPSEIDEYVPSSADVAHNPDADE
jgi:hypothetical protein